MPSSAIMHTIPCRPRAPYLVILFAKPLERYAKP
jgi:hypothetical protein